MTTGDYSDSFHKLFVEHSEVFAGLFNKHGMKINEMSRCYFNALQTFRN